jgi:hypothetical protein
VLRWLSFACPNQSKRYAAKFPYSYASPSAERKDNQLIEIYTRGNYQNGLIIYTALLQNIQARIVDKFRKDADRDYYMTPISS